MATQERGEGWDNRDLEDKEDLVDPVYANFIIYSEAIMHSPTIHRVLLETGDSMECLVYLVRLEIVVPLVRLVHVALQAQG